MADHHWHPNEVTCIEFVELVTDYLEGALPEERTDLVEEHLVLCGSCKAYLDQIEATVDAIPGAFAEEPAPAEVRTELLAKFREWQEQR
jgi:predicted anti-sigma-YlaC factor YlaD